MPRLACNECGREFAVDETYASPQALAHRNETGHLDYHPVPTLDELNAMDLSPKERRGFTHPFLKPVS